MDGAVTTLNPRMRAGVDAAMVNHWFGGKQGLFAAAVVDLPADPAAVTERLLSGDVETLGERMVRTFVGVWDHQEGPFAALVLSIASQELAGKMIAEFFTDAIFGRIAAKLDVDRAQERATLCATQIIGLGLARYVLKLEPIASADADWLARRIGPNLQTYLTGEL